MTVQIKIVPVQNLFRLVKYTFLICQMGLRGDDLLGPFQSYESLRF